MRARCEAGDRDGATIAALELYGREVLAYLTSVMRQEQTAWDVFQQFSTDLWQGLLGFGWNASLRTWCYTLARHAAARFLRKAYHHRESPIDSAAVAAIAESLRSTLPPHMRESAQEWLNRVRAELSLDEQTLLTLRIERQMSFDDIATVLSDEGQVVAAAALRKRYERLKRRLRELAARDGRLPEAG